MAFTFLYLAVRAVRSRGGLDVKDIELLALRLELTILRRQVARPKLRMADRALPAAAAVHQPRPQKRYCCLPQRRHPDRQDAGALSEGERDRRTLRPHRSLGVP
jgi:hypothetical protein